MYFIKFIGKNDNNGYETRIYDLNFYVNMRNFLIQIMFLAHVLTILSPGGSHEHRLAPPTEVEV